MKIQLSISLLASNRAASLERCLDSLRPLLIQVPSELIITFTGTDEKVKEIASRYTDKILSFTWCNNFSAARNVGLWAAKGEWFMYIDDDEWFEDVSEIRDFFLSGEYRNYGSAFYKQKNYTDWEGIHYSDFHAFRMAKIVPGMAFQNTVHEELVPRPEPGKYFNAHVNHYGYLSDKKQLSVDKSLRNIPLLVANIKERPSYTKNYVQIVQEYLIAEELDEAERYCREGKKLCKGYKDNYYRSCLQTDLLAILYRKGDHEATEQEALRILEKEHPWEISRLEIYAYLLTIYSKRRASEEVVKYGLLYEKTLAYMDANPELWCEQSYGDLTEARIKMPTKLYQIRMSCTESALKLGDLGQAYYFLNLFPWDEENWIQQYYPIFDNWKNQYEACFSELLSRFPEYSPYRLLQKALGLMGEIGDKEQQESFVQCMRGTESDYLRYQVIKEAILRETELTEIVGQINLEEWKTYTENIRKMIADGELEKLEAAAKQLCRNAPLYGLWLIKLLREEILIHEYLTGDALLYALEEYIDGFVRFYKIQYRDELFEENQQMALPKDCRFALCVSEALEKIKQEKFSESIRLFRKALHFYPKMTGVVREVIRQISIKAEFPAQNKGDEFRRLAEQMKEALRTMLMNGQYAEALPVILQLCPLLPEDLELLRMRQNVLREMSE